MATAAVMEVTAVASHRSSWRWRAVNDVDRGKAMGIAGRISTGIGYLQVLEMDSRDTRRPSRARIREANQITCHQSTFVG
jgi:hypothetical protein